MSQPALLLAECEYCWVELLFVKRGFSCPYPCPHPYPCPDSISVEMSVWMNVGYTHLVGFISYACDWAQTFHSPYQIPMTSFGVTARRSQFPVAVAHVVQFPEIHWRIIFVHLPISLCTRLAKIAINEGNYCSDFSGEWPEDRPLAINLPTALHYTGRLVVLPLPISPHLIAIYIASELYDG